jgi:anti-anti-sigma factor
MEDAVRDFSPEKSASYIVRGDCDLYSAPVFKEAVLKKIDAGIRHIRIDMTAVDYLDSSGVGAIICIIKAAKRSGGDVRFHGLAGSPRKVLARTNILGLINEGTGPIENPAV